MSLLKNVLLSAMGKKAKTSWTAAEIRRLVLEGKLEAAQAAIEALDPATPKYGEIQKCLRGELAFRQKQDDEAEAFFKAALETQPGLPDAHYGLSLIHHARGDSDAAVRYAIFAVNNGPDVRYMAQVGLCHLERQNYVKAKDWLGHAVLYEPRDKYSWNNLGVARRSLDNLVGARAAFARALSLDPGFEPALANAQALEQELEQAEARPEASPAIQASAPIPDDPVLEQVHHLLAKGDVVAAQDACEAALMQHPAQARYALELTQIHKALDDPQSAIDVLRAFRVAHPDEPTTRTRLATLLAATGVREEALSLVNKALEEDPQDVDALVTKADLLFDKSRFAEAGALLEQALALRPDTTNEGHLVASLSAQCRYRDALDHIEAIEKREPHLAPNLVPFRLDALTGLGLHDEILPTINQRLTTRPHDPGLHFHRASINLLRENYVEGWQDYAYRNVQDVQYARMFPFAPWRGEPLEGKSLLIGADQGLGDQIMFASCLRDVLALRPGRVVVEASKKIAETLRRSFPELEIIGTAQDTSLDWLVGMGHFDYACLIGDLPRHFRHRREDFPLHAGYLKVDPAKRARWQDELLRVDGGRRPRIGFSWKGGTERTRTTLRTMDIRAFDVLQDRIDATWVCLQYGEVQEAVDAAVAAGRPVVYWPQSIADLDEFAALIDGLDLVITVCNTTVHYAGALAKPVWVLAPKIPEWRYGLEFRSMPWYPSSVIFRQAVGGEWQPVLEEVGDRMVDWRQAAGV